MLVERLFFVEQNAFCVERMCGCVCVLVYVWVLINNKNDNNNKNNLTDIPLRKQLTPEKPLLESVILVSIKIIITRRTRVIPRTFKGLWKVY